MDELIDREIQNALSVEPSPDFMARVRVQIAGEPIAPRRSWAMRAAVACAVIVTMVVFVRKPPYERTESNRVTVIPQQAAASPAQPLQPSARPAEMVVVARPAVQSITTVRDDFPEVLISPADRAAFLQLVASASARRFEVSTDATIQLMSVHASNDLTIAPITIDALSPIEPLVASEGVNQ